MPRAPRLLLPMLALAPVIAASTCAPTSVCVTPDGDTVAVLAEAGRARQPREARVSATGSDLSDLPQLYPDGDWLPIEAPLLSMAVTASVTVNGEKAIATL